MPTCLHGLHRDSFAHANSDSCLLVCDAVASIYQTTRRHIEQAQIGSVYFLTQCSVSWTDWQTPQNDLVWSYACYMPATASTGWHWHCHHAQPLTWPPSTPTTRGQRPACWTSPQQNIAVISCLQTCGSTDWKFCCETGRKTQCWLVPNIGDLGANPEYRHFKNMRTSTCHLLCAGESVVRYWFAVRFIADSSYMPSVLSCTEMLWQKWILPVPYARCWQSWAE
jgi:hypothetical protein